MATDWNPFQVSKEYQGTTIGRRPQHETWTSIRGAPNASAMPETSENPMQHSLPSHGGNVAQAHSPRELPPQVIHVSHGCLLIPVFFMAWYYYTKKCIRKITGFIRNSPEPTDANEREKFHEKFARYEDAYIQWEDLMDDSKSGTATTDRFVKWINRRNVRRRHMQHEISTTTQRVLSGSSRNAISQDSLMNDKVESLHSNDDMDGSSTFSGLNQLSIPWDRLSDVGEMELCILTKDDVEEGAYTVTQQSLPTAPPSFAPEATQTQIYDSETPGVLS